MRPCKLHSFKGREATVLQRFFNYAADLPSVFFFFFHRSAQRRSFVFRDFHGLPPAHVRGH